MKVFYFISSSILITVVLFLVVGNYVTKNRDSTCARSSATYYYAPYDYDCFHSADVLSDAYGIVLFLAIIAFIVTLPISFAFCAMNLYLAKFYLDKYQTISMFERIYSLLVFVVSGLSTLALFFIIVFLVISTLK